MIIKYGRFFLSCLFAFVAGHMTNYSVILYSQDVLHSTLISGIGFGLCFGPPLILGWIAGVMCDRKPPSQIIHFATAVFLVSGLVFITAFNYFPSSTALVLLAAFIAGVGWSFVSPARMAALPQVVTASELKGASLIFNILVMLGFGLGPILISVCRAHWGWTGVIVVDMCLFAASSLLLLGYPMHSTSSSEQSILHSIQAGFSAVRKTPLIRDLLISAVFGFMLMGPIQVILPKFATEILNLTEIERGNFLGALAPSFILGGILCMILIRKLPNGALIFAAIFSAGAVFTFFSQLLPTQTAIITLVTVGTLAGIAMSTISALIQGQVDPSVRGRVLSMYTITSQVMPAISGVLAGTLVHFFGVQVAAAVCGLFLASAAILNSLWMNSLRKFKR